MTPTSIDSAEASQESTLAILAGVYTNSIKKLADSEEGRNIEGIRSAF